MPSRRIVSIKPVDIGRGRVLRVVEDGHKPHREVALRYGSHRLDDVAVDLPLRTQAWQARVRRVLGGRIWEAETHALCACARYRGRLTIIVLPDSSTEKTSDVPYPQRLK